MLTDRQKKLALKNGSLDEIYGERVSQLIREKYSLNAELALLRQKDENPEKMAEFEAYNAYAESCKVRARAEIYG